MKIGCAIAAALLLLPSGLAARTPDSVACYEVELTARNLSFEAVGTFPQRLLEKVCDTDTLKTVRIRTFNAYEVRAYGDTVKNAPYHHGCAYPDSVRRYLEPTRLVNSRSARTRSIADTLFSGSETRILEIVVKALGVSRRIVFDRELAGRLDRGESMTEPSDSVVVRGRGTCSEATNLFLALMRCMGIPARMVVGYGFSPQFRVCNSHAWAECYIDGFGWWPVDPQSGNPALPCFCYKLFTGSDFEDCRIRTLPDMYLRGEQAFRAKVVRQIIVPQHAMLR